MSVLKVACFFTFLVTQPALPKTSSDQKHNRSEEDQVVV